MKVLITGGHGMVGTALSKKIYSICPTRKELDLENGEKVLSFLLEHKPDIVFHLAARVGGVLENSKYPADFYIQNIRMNSNILDACYKTGVKKVISVLSTCVYPDKVEYPLTEYQLHNGFPHHSNFTYAFTKRMLDVQSRAYRKQYDCNFVCVIPNNIYGPNDQYGEGCHVIPALMLRFHEAKINELDKVEIWGSGNCMREFTYSDDIADYMLYIMEYYDDEEPINIGYNKEYTIKELVESIKEIVGYNGKVVFNSTMPEGQFQKPSSITKFKNLMKDKEEIKFTTLFTGLEKTYKWFTKNYPNLRGLK